ncbi:WD40 repeat-like protein [Mycena filopes]|nr:WD40 repeat-like protein [Mycena filopes]
MAAFQPTVVRTHPRPSTSKHSPESRYWRQFKHPVFVKEYAPPCKPHRFAVTAATRIQIYAPRTQKITKTISRFKDVARSGSIRADGKLVVAGDDSGLVQVFDINSRAILRTLDSHKQPVHVAKFSALTPTQVLSCSDDTTAKIWDVPSQTAISTFTSHTDYVRSGQMVMGGASGGGDAPVEQVLMFPSGTRAGRCTRALSNHQKTVTALAFDGNASRLLTGGLDQMVKVYDVSTYKVVHTMRYPAPILCLAISPDETHIAAGMSDGTLSVRRRQPKASEASGDAASALRSGAFESFLGTSFPSLGQGSLRQKTKPKALGDVDEFRVESRRAKRLRDYDRLLKSFKYSAALDTVLRKQVPPTTTFSLIQELIHRDGLRIALTGRDDVQLEPVLRLLVKHVTDPRFGEMACDVAGIVIEMYTPVLGQSPLIDSLFLRLRKKVSAELRFQKELLKTKGALDMVLATAASLAR